MRNYTPLDETSAHAHHSGLALWLRRTGPGRFVVARSHYEARHGKPARSRGRPSPSLSMSLELSAARSPPPGLRAAVAAGGRTSPVRHGGAKAHAQCPEALSAR
jgi:hypothetical protein